jgi:hypothetical protein
MGVEGSVGWPRRGIGKQASSAEWCLFFKTFFFSYYKIRIYIYIRLNPIIL